MIKGVTEPRIYTPPLRELTPDTTLGYDVADFSREVLGITLNPWQEWLLIHALEIIGDFDGEWTFRFRTVIVLVGRQQGKTTLGAVLSLFFLYALHVSLVLGTAQDLEQAEDTWAMCVDIAQGDPELAEQIEHVWRTNGAKRLSLTGGRDYRVKASTRKAGRGKSADLILLDELREHRTWDAYSALSKTGIARKNALLWCMSNAGDGTSVVLRHLRLKAHAELGDPDGIVADIGNAEPPAEDEIDGTLGIFEWSAPPDADKRDPRAWAQACPSIGYTVSERAIRSACATDPDDVFKTECLCQWVTAKITPPFPVGAWDAGIDAKSGIAPDSPLTWAVDVSSNREKSAIAVCGLRSDRKWHVEVVAYRSGVRWVTDWISERSMRQPMRIALQGRGAPVASIADAIAAVDGVEVVECVGRDVSAWCGRFWDSVSACLSDSESDAVPVMHRPQPALDLAAQIASTRPLGDGAWAWDRDKSLDDISTLVAASMAFGAATMADKQTASAYESDELLIL